ncbi:serine/threonine-protein kinase [Desulfatitalea alkaliphila]|uniref:Serine/threonine-protein kinase n=1 Tax=Desulfatitalea alkaliphila TaxID=2929485 RepID=A0AA41URV1_9BACT|nr:serine/threonine-protein kinase [Desulfatitalea alkaliphila]MCJ8502663.1 serine/threonine-protein kinase [Desulfatitalea alkaliphila]
MDEDVKYWVKRAIDLHSGDAKIIKLAFHEKFTSRIGDIAFECFRSPRKEARILDLVAGHGNFMQGFAVEDEKGNVVRVLDLIHGRPLSKYIEGLNVGHRTYFTEQFPGILEQFMACIRAIAFLHEHGEKHGDIRRDHIFIDREDHRYRWIDFDFNFRHRENIYAYDLFGLGNILLFLAGKGDVLLHDLRDQQSSLLDVLQEEDLNIVFHNRVANLKKIYSYIPESLNRVCMHFAKGANWYYESATQLHHDLEVFKNEWQT